jgi:hypothetical protein
MPVEGTTLETKFEYQVSPELAEKIALEQFDLLLRSRGIKLRYLPLGIGCLLALLFFCAPLALNLGRPSYNISGSYFKMGGTYYAFSENFLFVPIGFVAGITFGLLMNYFLRSRILSMARSAYQKMGPSRIVSWNSESILFQSPAYETKIRWQMIDRIEIGGLGIYGFFDHKAFFVIPLDAFPPNVIPQDLVKTWQSCRRQPPAMT